MTAVVTVRPMGGSGGRPVSEKQRALGTDGVGSALVPKHRGPGTRSAETGFGLRDLISRAHISGRERPLQLRGRCRGPASEADFLAPLSLPTAGVRPETWEPK